MARWRGGVAVPAYVAVQWRYAMRLQEYREAGKEASAEAHEALAELRAQRDALYAAACAEMAAYGQGGEG